MECLATLADSSGKVYDMYRAQDAVLAALAVPALSAGGRRLGEFGHARIAAHDW